MCILFLYINGNPNSDHYKVILASNRDEYYKRPTLAADAWTKDDFVVYSGRDQQNDSKNGTWLAISFKDEKIKIASLLNVTGEHKSNTKSRGVLVSDYVTNNSSIDEYLSKLIHSEDVFSGFNLILTEINESNVTAMQYCNTSDTKHILPDGKCYVFGNVTPTEIKQSKKAQNGQNIFEKIVNGNLPKDPLVKSLLDMLKNKQRHWPDEALQKRAPVMGEYLSSFFIEIPERAYGTRTHTIILIDKNNQMDYYEETLIQSESNNVEWQKSHYTRQL